MLAKDVECDPNIDLSRYHTILATVKALSTLQVLVTDVSLFMRPFF